MKFKSSKSNGRLVVELGPNDAVLPSAKPAVFGMKRIVVPMDFSAPSERALDYALGFAKQFDAKVTIVHVVQPFANIGDASDFRPDLLVDTMRRDADRRLREIRDGRGLGVVDDTLVLLGTPHVEVVRAAKVLEADLLVISTHGRTGLAHLLLGSTAERIVRHAGCPVLVVRENEHDFIPPTKSQKKTKKDSSRKEALV